MVWLLAVLVLLAALYLFLISPGRRGKDVSALRGFQYAHRGLHDNQDGAPENSLAAFKQAVEAGFGMELDVQLTKDGQLAVFHDKTLKRMCGADVCLSELSCEEVQNYTLLGTQERITLFSQVLELVNGRVPLIVEIKHYTSVNRTAQETNAMLSRYKGPYCVESFHPLAMRWFKKNAPQVVRGQLASGVITRESPAYQQAALKYLLVNVLSRPDFVSYDIREDKNISIFLLRRLFRPLWVAWTVRTAEEYEKAKQKYDLQIFEGFMPNH
jgi:glycerophosphoryl diester phosphodiesterase